jgi:metallo-beta-lactamase class B
VRRLLVLGVFLWAVGVRAQAPAKDSPCRTCAEWNQPQTPFRIYGDTYYVGPHGLASILIVSPQGDVLIDGALAESAPQIAANVRALGFRIEDVKLIVISHVHFDHAGGVAELQRMSGARVIANPWSAAVLKSGEVAKDDPQFGDIRPIDPVAKVETLYEGETLRVGPIAITAHATPGHTPGGTSWTWKSCEDGTCLDMVYADSVSAASAASFKFTANPAALASFEKSFNFLETEPCDILLTPHGEASDFWARVEAHKRGVDPDPMIDPGACKRLAASARVAFRKRIDTERAGNKPAAIIAH